MLTRPPHATPCRPPNDSRDPHPRNPGHPRAHEAGAGGRRRAIRGPGAWIGLLLLPVVTACGDAPADDAVRTSVAPLPAARAVLDPTEAQLDFVRPRAVAAYADGWLVLDAGTSRIAALSADFGIDHIWGEPGQGPAELSGPVSVAPLADGTVAVLERDRRAVSFWEHGSLVVRYPAEVTSATYVIASDGEAVVCWPAPEHFRECLDRQGEATRGPPLSPPDPDPSVLPLPSLLAFGGDGLWYRYDNTTGALLRESRDGDRVDALPLPPEVHEALAVPELVPVGGTISLGYGGVRDLQITPDGVIHFVLEHARDHEIVTWSPHERLVRYVPTAIDRGRAWSLAFRGDHSSVILRDAAIELRGDRLTLVVHDGSVDVMYVSGASPGALAFIEAVAPVDQMVMVVSPEVASERVAELEAAARAAGVRRLVVEQSGESGTTAGSTRIHVEAVPLDHLSGLDGWTPATARWEVQVDEGVGYGQVAAAEALLIDLGASRVTVHAAGTGS